MVADLTRKAAFELLRFLSTFKSIEAIKELNEAIDDGLPEDIQATPIDENFKIPDGISRKECSYFNYDEAHSGRFSLFGSDGATIEAKHVLNRPNPLKYIRENLSYGDNEEQKETVIFVNGMRTASQEGGKVAGTGSAKRVQFYSDTLLGTKLAHVHTATNLDQPPGRINVKKTGVLKLLTTMMGILGVKLLAPDENGDIQVPQTALDILQGTLSVAGVMDTPIKSTLRELIKLASKDNPLTLMVYSRGSMECSGAIKEVLLEAEQNGKKEECLQQMSEGLTVMTIGASAKSWLDGPAYIHLSSWDDVIARTFCNAHRNTMAGKDAIFLHNHSPYKKTFDSHNFQAGTAQFLSVVMLQNEVTSFRELWCLGQYKTIPRTKSKQTEQNLNFVESGLGFAKRLVGKNASEVGGGAIKIPQDLDKLVDSMISITDAVDHLWDENSAKGMRPPPSKPDALKYLNKYLEDSENIKKIAGKFEKRKEKK